MILSFEATDKNHIASRRGTAVLSKKFLETK
jgi:hypothetical protein